MRLSLWFEGEVRPEGRGREVLGWGREAVEMGLHEEGIEVVGGCIREEGEGLKFMKEGQCA